MSLEEELDLHEEKYLHLLFDTASALELQPLFLDAVVHLLNSGENLTETNFLCTYVLRLARSLLNEALAGLKSRRPEIVKIARNHLQFLSKDEVQPLGHTDLYILFHCTVNGDEKHRPARRLHLEAIALAKEEIEEQKNQSGKSGIVDLINECLREHLHLLLITREKADTLHIKMIGKQLGFGPHSTG